MVNFTSNASSLRLYYISNIHILVFLGAFNKA